MPCPTLPAGRTREIIQKTIETGREHAYVKCADGSVTDTVSGGEKRMDVSSAINECDLSDGPVTIVHTHPNGVRELSKVDRELAAAEHVEAVCVAVDGDGENVKCETVDSCVYESEAEA